MAARARRKRSLWLGGAVLSALLGVVLLWRALKNPRPKLYVSPRLDSSGVRFRMELPVGWEVQRFTPMPPRGAAELMIGERNTDWRPQLLAKLWPRSYQPRPFMFVQIFRRPLRRPPRNLSAPASGDSLAWREDFPPQPGETVIAPNGTLAHQVYYMGRSYFTPDDVFQIYVQYHREDTAQLYPTLNAMGKTFRLIK